MTDWKNRPIALVGLMGAGKSAVARVLAGRLGVPVVSLDELLEREQGRSISEMFATLGESAFRRLEAEMLARARDSGAGVIDCGGGVVLLEANRLLLRERCRTAWLEVDAATAAARVGNGRTRPLLGTDEPIARLSALLAERGELYAEVANARIPTTRRDPTEVAERVVAALAEPPK